MKVYKYPDEMLKMVCYQEVKSFDSEIHQILDEMAKTMLEGNGIGLAANQVGYALRMFVMLDKETGEVIDVINPKVTHWTDDMKIANEGCLSAPGLFLNIARHRWIRVEFQDRNGEDCVAELDGIEAACFQHELDHLNGIFFLDKGNRQDRRKAAKILKLRR